jgi:hypothetical protein
MTAMMRSRFVQGTFVVFERAWAIPNESRLLLHRPSPNRHNHPLVTQHQAGHHHSVDRPVCLCFLL